MKLWYILNLVVLSSLLLLVHLLTENGINERKKERIFCAATLEVADLVTYRPQFFKKSYTLYLITLIFILFYSCISISMFLKSSLYLSRRS